MVSSKFSSNMGSGINYVRGNSAIRGHTGRSVKLLENKPQSRASIERFLAAEGE